MHRYIRDFPLPGAHIWGHICDVNRVIIVSLSSFLGAQVFDGFISILTVVYQDCVYEDLRRNSKDMCFTAFC